MKVIYGILAFSVGIVGFGHAQGIDMQRVELNLTPLRNYYNSIYDGDLPFASISYRLPLDGVGSRSSLSSDNEVKLMGSDLIIAVGYGMGSIIQNISELHPKANGQNPISLKQVEFSLSNDIVELQRPLRLLMDWNLRAAEFGVGIDDNGITRHDVVSPNDVRFKGENHMSWRWSFALLTEVSEYFSISPEIQNGYFLDSKGMTARNIDRVYWQWGVNVSIPLEISHSSNTKMGPEETRGKTYNVTITKPQGYDINIRPGIPPPNSNWMDSTSRFTEVFQNDQNLDVSFKALRKIPVLYIDLSSNHIQRQVLGQHANSYIESVQNGPKGFEGMVILSNGEDFEYSRFSDSARVVLLLDHIYKWQSASPNHINQFDKMFRVLQDEFKNQLGRTTYDITVLLSNDGFQKLQNSLEDYLSLIYKWHLNPARINYVVASDVVTESSFLGSAIQKIEIGK